MPRVGNGNGSVSTWGNPGAYNGGVASGGNNVAVPPGYQQGAPQVDYGASQLSMSDSTSLSTMNSPMNKPRTNASRTAGNMQIDYHTSRVGFGNAPIDVSHYDPTTQGSTNGMANGAGQQNGAGPGTSLASQPLPTQPSPNTGFGANQGSNISPGNPSIGRPGAVASSGSSIVTGATMQEVVIGVITSIVAAYVMKYL